MLKKGYFILFLSFMFNSASGQFWGVLAETLLLDGFWYVIIETPEEPRWYETTFASYPYDMPGTGLYLSPEFEGDNSRLNFNWQVLSNEGGILGAYFQLKYSPISLLALDAYRLQYFDPEKEVGSENLNITSTAIIYNRLRHSKIHAWWGLGSIWVDDEENFTTASLNVGANYYFRDPISLYGEAQYGVNDDQFIAISQLRLQLHLRRFIVYGGFHRTRIGDQKINSWMIGGGAYF